MTQLNETFETASREQGSKDSRRCEATDKADVKALAIQQPHLVQVHSHRTAVPTNTVFLHAIMFTIVAETANTTRGVGTTEHGIRS